MFITSPSRSILRLFAGLGLALSVAACAPQASGPQASAPPASQMSLSPSPGTAAPAGGGIPMSGNMQGMDHSRMPGMSGSNMQGMDHSNMPGMQGHNMSGMNMQQMMAHCAQMRTQARPGAPMTADMQAMMAHCDQMGGTSGTPARR